MATQTFATMNIGVPCADARGGILNIETLLETIADLADRASCDTSYGGPERYLFERIHKLGNIALEQATRAIADVNQAEDAGAAFIRIAA